MLDKLIGDTEASHLLDVAVLREPILDRATCTATNNTIFDRNHALETLGNLGEQLLIKRFCPAHIVVRHRDTLLLRARNSLGDEVTHRAEAHHSHLIAIVEATSATDFEHREGLIAPLCTHTSTTRIANCNGLIGLRGGVHHIAQFDLVHRCCEHQIGHTAQRRKIQCAVMRCAIFANQTCAVKAHNHR